MDQTGQSAVHTLATLDLEALEWVLDEAQHLEPAIAARAARAVRAVRTWREQQQAVPTHYVFAWDNRCERWLAGPIEGPRYLASTRAGLELIHQAIEAAPEWVEFPGVDARKLTQAVSRARADILGVVPEFRYELSRVKTEDGRMRYTPSSPRVEIETKLAG